MRAPASILRPILVHKLFKPECSVSLTLRKNTSTPRAALNMAPNTSNKLRPVVMSGPSGAGKSTLKDILISRHPNTFGFSVSHTTREPRAGENDGEHYFFVTKERFAELVRDGAFLEHAQFAGNSYGTSFKTVADIQSRGEIPLLDIEMEGVKQVQAHATHQLHARFVSVRPPSLQDLEIRLKARGTDTDEKIEKRLGHARAEIEFAESGAFDCVIINDDRELAYKQLENFIFGNST